MKQRNTHDFTLFYFPMKAIHFLRSYRLAEYNTKWHNLPLPDTEF
jgi:hypothetical protein